MGHICGGFEPTHITKYGTYWFSISLIYRGASLIPTVLSGQRASHGRSSQSEKGFEFPHILEDFALESQISTANCILNEYLRISRTNSSSMRRSAPGPDNTRAQKLINMIQWAENPSAYTRKNITVLIEQSSPVVRKSCR